MARVEPLENYEKVLAKLEKDLEILEDKIKDIGYESKDKESDTYKEMKRALDAHKRGFNSYTSIISTIGLGNSM